MNDIVSINKNILKKKQGFNTLLTAVFERLQILMRTERLFIDPDISLSRIARRLALLVRSVSRAINA